MNFICKLFVFFFLIVSQKSLMAASHVYRLSDLMNLHGAYSEKVVPLTEGEIIQKLNCFMEISDRLSVLIIDFKNHDSEEGLQTIRDRYKRLTSEYDCMCCGLKNDSELALFIRLIGESRIEQLKELNARVKSLNEQLINLRNLIFQT